MAKMKLAQLDNKGKETGHVQEFDEEMARRILSNPKTCWKEVTGSKSVSAKEETTKSK